MSRRGFLEQATRQRATQAIRQIESETAVEVVVAVRKRASRYPRTSLACGAAVALVVLLVLLLSPTIYLWLWIVVDTLLAFLLATAMFSTFTPLRMAFTTARSRRAAVEQGARRAFDELGIRETKERTGLLVYAALEERSVRVVADEGVPEEVLGEEYHDAVLGLQEAVATLNEEAFLAALLRLERPLSQVLPRQPDDENELSDDVA